MRNKKQPRNREKVLEFVNNIRKDIGKAPLSKMPITWSTTQRKRIGTDKINFTFEYEKKEFSTCPIERAITGIKYDSCPISVGTNEVTAPQGSDLDKAFKKRLGDPTGIETDYNNYDDPDALCNVYRIPDYCKEFIYDVDVLSLSS